MVLRVSPLSRPLGVGPLDNFNLLKVGQNMQKIVSSTDNKIKNYLSNILGFA